ncbi:MAG TPA: lanthionine synthetase C family protein [Thermoanaerobaculia bacterium]|nr:lanthionine synthetase C family protein [Thermoanaerobaculia bacterium]
MSAGWEPLLTGDSAAEARRAVTVIAAELPASLGWMPTGVPELAWRTPLASGHAGQALFYAYLALDGSHRKGGEGGASETALDLLDQAIAGAARVPMNEGFYQGFTGIAWTSEHLRGRLFEEEDGGDPNLAVDELLLTALAASPWPGEYDLLGGLVGIGIYALERLPRPSAVACLERVVERLAERAERPAGEGARWAWFSPPEALAAHKRERHPAGRYDLGLAHGAAGVIALLGAACRAGVAAAEADELLRGAVPWLLERALPASAAGLRFPLSYAPDAPFAAGRLAWCYGDLGIASALAIAGEGAGEPAWRRAAIEIAKGAAACPLADSKVVDAGLCHGAAGAGHLFHRLYRATGEETLAAAARAWLERALAMREPGRGIAGFRSWVNSAEEPADWRDDAGFLTGAAGVGLALLAAVSPVEPEWDRAMLLSLRPPSRLSGAAAP